MIELKITGETPLEALATLTAFGCHCIMNPDVNAAANRIMEREKAKAGSNPATEPVHTAAPSGQNAIPGNSQPAIPTSAVPVQSPVPSPQASVQISAGVPTSPAPEITGDMVAKAGADLLTTNPGTLAALNGLLQKYGVSCAQELRPDQIGAFATEMRGLGAKI